MVYLQEIGSIAAPLAQMIFKMIYIIINHEKFHAIYRSIAKLWMIFDDKQEREHFEKILIIAKHFSMALFIAGIGDVLLTIIASTVIGINRYHANKTAYTRILPFDAW